MEGIASFHNTWSTESTMKTEAVAVELNEAIGPYRKQHRPYSGKVFDRHAGVFETSLGLYLFPSLVDMASARTAALEMPSAWRK